MILLSITDYEGENFNLNYSDIMFHLREFNNNKKLKSSKIKDNIKIALHDCYLNEMNEIPKLYVDIINKTLDYVSSKKQNKIILENNIDLIIMDNIYFFYSFYNTS